jgi:hypothetical protein
MTAGQWNIDKRAVYEELAGALPMAAPSAYTMRNIQ